MKIDGKRRSGAQRRAWARVLNNTILSGLLRPGKPGRPRGQSAKVQRRLEQLKKHLAWIGNPKKSNLELVNDLQNKREYRDSYKGISKRTLRRDVEIVQRQIWGPKRRGQYFGQQKR